MDLRSFLKSNLNSFIRASNDPDLIGIKQALTKASICALVYADIFDYPLTKAEIRKYLPLRITSENKFNDSLNLLLKQKQVWHQAQFWTLLRRRRLVKLRLEREKISRVKLNLARKYAQILSWFPNIWLIGISGALAMRNCPENDDIDFFIITSPGTMWLTRLIVTLTLDLLGVRRQPHVLKFTDKICVNMYMDAGNLLLPVKEQDLYTAHEICQLQVLVNKHHIFEKFIHTNLWVKRYLPHALNFTKIVSRPSQLWKIFQPLEFVAKIIQLWYMRRRRTTEIIRPQMLKFHPQDMREWVMKEYGRRIRRISTN